MELGVDALLRGSFERTADRLTVAAELVGTTDGRRLWSGAYERKASELQAAERSISKAVAHALAGPSTALERRLPDPAAEVNTEAYELFLRGLSHVGATPNQTPIRPSRSSNAPPHSTPRSFQSRPTSRWLTGTSPLSSGRMTRNGRRRDLLRSEGPWRSIRIPPRPTSRKP
jgi:hypothetical protein